MRYTVLFDTNVLISILLTPLSETPPVALYRRAIEGDFALVVSETTLEELRERTRRKPYLSRRISPDEVDTLESTLRRIATTIVPASADRPPAATRDPKDDYLLVPEIRRLVDHIVTGDRDLIEAEGLPENFVLTPVAFLRVLDEQRKTDQSSSA